MSTVLWANYLLDGQVTCAEADLYALCKYADKLDKLCRKHNVLPFLDTHDSTDMQFNIGDAELPEGMESTDELNRRETRRRRRPSKRRQVGGGLQGDCSWGKGNETPGFLNQLLATSKYIACKKREEEVFIGGCGLFRAGENRAHGQVQETRLPGDAMRSRRSDPGRILSTGR